METHRIKVSLVLVSPLVIRCHSSDFCFSINQLNLSAAISKNHYKTLILRFFPFIHAYMALCLLQTD